MPTLISRYFSWTFVLLVAMAAQSQDLRVKKSITVDGNPVSSTETFLKGSRERIVSQSPTGSTVTLKQCDLKRTITINEKTETYFVAQDPKDEVAAGTSAADTGAYITETSVVTDSGEGKTMFGLPTRHLKTTVTVQSSKDACTQVSKKYEVDGWYADLSKEQSVCQPFLPPVREGAGCSDRIIHKRSGSGKLGYPLWEAITLHNDHGTSTLVNVKTSGVSKKALEQGQFEIPGEYHEVKSLAELNEAPAIVQQAAVRQPISTQPGAPSQPTVAAAPPSVTAAQTPGARTRGKIRIGIAPPEAQVGQGTNTGGDYSTPIRNAEIALMSGPAVDVTPLDSHIAMQLQAEAQQKQCDYIMYSSVSVKHNQGGAFSKFAKYGGLAASMTPMGAMAHGMGGAMAAEAAGMAASQMAQQQAMNQLAAFNGQIKSKDDVTVEYQLVAIGQTAPLLQNTLQGKAKSNGEDVLTPLLQQAATGVLTEVSKR